MRPQLEVERDHLKEEVQQLQKKYLESHEVGIEAQARVKELMDRVDAAEQNSLHNSQQLANTSANMQAFSKSKVRRQAHYTVIVLSVYACLRLEDKLIILLYS